MSATVGLARLIAAACAMVFGFARPMNDRVMESGVLTCAMSACPNPRFPCARPLPTKLRTAGTGSLTLATVGRAITICGATATWMSPRPTNDCIRGAGERTWATTALCLMACPRCGTATPTTEWTAKSPAANRVAIGRANAWKPPLDRATVGSESIISVGLAAGA